MRRASGSGAVAWAVFQHAQVQITLYPPTYFEESLGRFEETLLHFLLAQPWGELHADGMQILLTLLTLIFPNYAFKSGKKGLQIHSFFKFICHQQLKKRGKEKEMVN